MEKTHKDVPRCVRFSEFLKVHKQQASSNLLFLLLSTRLASCQQTAVSPAQHTSPWVCNEAFTARRSLFSLSGQSRLETGPAAAVKSQDTTPGSQSIRPTLSHTHAHTITNHSQLPPT